MKVDRAADPVQPVHAHPSTPLPTGADSRKASGREPRAKRFACKFIFTGFDPQRDADFELVPRLIGRGGANVRQIAEACDGKVRIRGRGSGHREHRQGMSAPAEADLPLQVALSCADAGGFSEGCRRLLCLLELTATHFERYCKKKGIEPAPALFLLAEG